MNWKPNAASLAVAASMIFGTGCLTPQPTKYETVEERVEVLRAPAGTVKKKVALVNFRNLTDKSYLVQPATAQLVSLMVQSGYFEVIEPTLVESVISAQDQVTTEKLQTLKDKFGADYFLTGSLTNFEVKESSSATCLLLGLLGSRSTKEYTVETAIDYRFVSVPSAQILSADVVENKRTDSSSSTGILLSSAGTDVRVLQSSGGKLLRYSLRDMVNRLTKEM
jgi:curli biogenesis system outer membrane secretion channel CsgG